MVRTDEMAGKYVTLKSATLEDALFTSKLRADEQLIKFVHKVDCTLEGQMKYIQSQREKPDDFYFIIRSLRGESLGTIALYHINDGSGELGRWLSYGNAAENLESVMLLHDMAYEELGLDMIYTCTDNDNERVKNFWKHFGGDECFVEELPDLTVSKNIIKKSTYSELIRPRIADMLRYK